MILYLVIYMLSVVQIHCFILQNSYNIKLEDDAHYKIGETLDEEELEMISEDDIHMFHIGDRKKRLYDFNSKTSKKPIKWIRPSKTIETNNNKDSNNNVKKVVNFRTAPVLRTTFFPHKVKRTIEVEEEPYDYDEALAEYYEESIYGYAPNRIYHPQAEEAKGFIQTLKRIISLDNSSRDANGIGLKAIRQMILDYKEQRKSTKEMKTRLWNMVKIWLIIYLVVAIPFWCMKGWCCCCLYCKFFRPRTTIEEAKRYLIQNPPGMLKTRTSQTLYEPTDKERQSYREFEHLIKII